MGKCNRNEREPNTKCLICGKEYFRFPYEIRSGVKLYCSTKCSGIAQQVHHEPNTKCAVCGKVFYRRPTRKNSKSGLYFCSKECQNIGYAQHLVLLGNESKFLTREERTQLNKKQRDDLRNKRNKHILGRTCITCGKIINDNNRSGYCLKCYAKVRFANATQEQRRKWSEDAKRRMADGKIKPWQSRNTLSYPEKFFKKVLEDNNIPFEGPNYVIKHTDLGVQNCIPSSCYFLDFKIGNIDLEIDGKQHWSLEDRIKSDKIRDERLTKAGYIVYRIKWREINSYEGKQYIKDEINKLLNFIKNKQLDK